MYITALATDPGTFFLKKKSSTETPHRVKKLIIITDILARKNFKAFVFAKKPIMHKPSIIIMEFGAYISENEPVGVTLLPYAAFLDSNIIIKAIKQENIISIDGVS